LKVLYSKSCFESRMRNLSEPTFTRTLATLKTELVSFDDLTVTVAYSARVVSGGSTERKEGRNAQ
jgi:hypothetical protein